MPLNLNSDKLTVVVKPDETTYIYTGATTQLANVGSGEEIYKGLLGTTSELRTLVAGTNMLITEVGDTLRFDAGITGGTFQMIGSGDTTVTNPSGNTWVVYTPSGATGDFVTTAEFSGYTGITAPASFLPITGLTGYWNSGQTVDYVQTQVSGISSSWNDVTDKPEWLSGTTLESFQTGHTHSYNNLTDLPTLFDGDYDDLTNKPDLSLYQPVSGMSAYLTGVTFSMITGAVSGSTTLQAALDLKLDNSVYNGDMLIIGDEIDNLITGVTANTQSITEKLDTSVFITYSGTTVPNLLLGYTQTGTTENLSQAFDAHTGDTGIHFEMSQITGFTSTDSFNTFTGDTQTALDAKASKYAGLWLSTSNTQIDDNYNNYIIETNGTFNLTFDDDGGGLSDGFRCWIYNIGTGTISILGNVGAVIRGNTGITSQYDMVEVYYNSTGRIFSVSPVTVDTSGFLSTTDFNTYTGNTAPYLVVSGFTASGGTQLDLTNGNLTIYSPTGGTSSVTTLIGSGDTTVDNVSGSTWVIYSESGGGSSSSIVQKTGSTYTLQSEDNGNILEFTNTGSTTITLPSGFTANFQCTVVNYGNGTSSGVKTIAAGGGATLKSALSATKLSTIFGAATVYYRGTNTWLAFGDLTA